MAGEFLGGLLGGGVGSVIGGSVVRLFLDDSQFNRALASAQAKNKSVSGTMASGWQKFGMIAAAATVVAGVALVKFAIGAVSAYRQAQEEQLKLSNSIENSTTVTKESIPVFQAQAKALRDLTGVDDDAINSFQGMLVQQGLTAAQVTELTPLVVDLSVKMGKDLNTAALAVGKAALGTTGALARMVGPIKAGKTPAETYANVLTKLGHASGFAAAQAKEQPWILMQARWEQLHEDLGRKLLPILVKLADFMVKFLADLPDAVGTAENAFLDFANVFIFIYDAFAKWFVNPIISGINLVLDGMDKLLGPFINFPSQAGLPMVNSLDEVKHGALGVIEAEGQLSSDTDGLGYDFTKTGKIITRFAHMSAADVRKLSASAKEDISAMADSLDSFDRHWSLSSKHMATILRGMRDKLKDYRNDLKDLRDEDWVPQGFQRWLLTQGPDAIHAFEGATKTGKEHMIADWKAIQGEIKANKTIIDGVTRSISAIPKHVTVNVDVNIRSHSPGSTWPGTDAAVADAIRHQTAHP